MARRRLTEEGITSGGLEPPEAFECPFCKSKMLSEECARIDKITWKCATCNAGLSQANATVIELEKPSPDLPKQASNGMKSDLHTSSKDFEVLSGNEKETVTVTWGEELYTPRQFCSFRVGPFSATTVVRKGETRPQAMTRLMRELSEVGEAERVRKRQDFARSLTELFGQVKTS